jgi:large conductance mechanosensitive channel
MSILKEFKEFAIRGNVVDLAVGVIIGTAFGKIVTSVVNDIIMPPIGYILGGTKFSNLVITLKAAAVEGDVLKPAVTINYGNFIQVIVDFFIVAFVIFMIIKTINAVQRKKVAALTAEPTDEVKLLGEIRDLLKK